MPFTSGVRRPRLASLPPPVLTFPVLFACLLVTGTLRIVPGQGIATTGLGGVPPPALTFPVLLAPPFLTGTLRVFVGRHTRRARLVDGRTIGFPPPARPFSLSLPSSF